DQGITDIVRGYDLLDNTPWQGQLQQALGLSTPRYLHLPLVVTQEGQKLSKQNLAPALAEDADGIRQQLFQALQLLDQAPPEMLVQEPPETQLNWAIAHWSVEKLVATTHRRYQSES
ncbi:MAG: glutamate--tRNA ligase family protein, partial [Vreelandella alkaliphila]